MPRFTQRQKRYSLKQAAKELGLKTQDFKRALRKRGFLIEQNGITAASSHMLQKHYMTHTQVPYFVGPVMHTYNKVLITEKGMNFFWSAAREKANEL